MTIDHQATEKEPSISLAGGRIRCARCQAMSKRTKLQCGAPAMKGKRVCRTHGGLSCGPVTDAGKQRSAAARTTYGHETRQLRAERSKKLAELRELEVLARSAGIMSGPATPGRKPTGG